jgi:hypothetical protein
MEVLTLIGGLCVSLTNIIGVVACVAPCWDGLEYLYRNPASRERQRKCTPVPGGLTEPPCCWGIEIEGSGPPIWQRLK